jgi:subtilisin family serine protease
MNFRKLTAFSTIVLTFGLGVSVVNAQGKIYWTQGWSGAIRRANLDGSNIEDLVTTGLTCPRSIALELVSRKIYWADSCVGKIQRADLDGANVEDLVSGVRAYEIALDVSGGKMYWTHLLPSYWHEIQRANLEIPTGQTPDNRTDIEDLVTGLSNVEGIALDVADGRMYWAQWGTVNIQRATLDGADVEDLVSLTGDDEPYALALDLDARKMYWMSAGADFQHYPKIQRANLDGSGVEVLVDPAVFGVGLGVDPGAGKMYWTTGESSILRANLDGSGIEIVLDNLSSGPYGIALDLRAGPIPTLSEWGMIATAALLLGTGAVIIQRRGGCRNQPADSSTIWKRSIMTRHCHVFTILALVFWSVMSSAAVAQSAPRTPLPKPATITKPAYETRLTVKFRDDLRVRAVAGDVTSLVSADLGSVHVVKEQFGLSFEPMIRLPQATLQHIETRAAQRSGFAQPDLAGMMAVYGPDHTLEAAAQALLALDEVEWVYFSALNHEDPCVDIPPTTPNDPSYFGLRGVDPLIRDYHGPNPGLDMTCARTYGARGQGIQIADCETGYYRGHEDLCEINEPEGQEFWEPKDHGNAVLGILVALDNAYGWTGLVPDAIPWFFSERLAGEPMSPEGRARAIANALATVDPGDIVLLEMQTYYPFSPGWPEWAPAEVEPGVWTLTCAATQSGIIVVAAAGNFSNHDLDSPEFAEYRSRICTGIPSGDSGAIIVGAGTADTNHDRLSDTTYGQRVNVQGWGQNVFTLGYGNYDFPGWDPRQAYTHIFGGTSSASALVAGAAAALQSLRVNHVPPLDRLTSPQMRQLLIDTGIPQGSTTASTHIGPLPDMGKAIL